MNIFRITLSAATSLALGLGAAQGQILEDIIPDDIFPDDVFEIEGDDTYIDVGAAYVTSPAYLGSTQQDSNFYPVINAEYKGRIFANPYNGIGVNLFDTGPVRLATSVNLVGGRSASETPFDDASFDVDSGAGVSMFGRYTFKYGAIDVKATQSISGGNKGSEVSARLGTLYPIADQVKLIPSVGINYQSSKWRNAYWGITGERAAATNVGTFDYGSGFGNYNASLGVLWQSENEKYALLGFLSYRELVGDVKDSPLAVDDSGFLAVAAAARRF